MASDQNDRPDLVYIVGPGQPESETELIYSIRSMEKFLSNFGKLIIIGHCPSAITPDVHIVMPDPHPGKPALNIRDKIMTAAALTCVSDPFLCCSDDYFLLRPYDARTFPWYYAQDLSHSFGQYNPLNYYRQNIEQTIRALTSQGFSTRDFNVHAPILLHKDALQLIHALFERYWSVDSGLLLKSLYCNTLGIFGRKLADCKISTPKTPAALQRALQNRPWFSTGEHAINSAMLSFLQSSFPLESSFEKVKNN